MDRFLRYVKLHALLKSHHHPISRSKLELELEASTATAKRIICELRNYGTPRSLETYIVLFDGKPHVLGESLSAASGVTLMRKC